MTGPIVPVGAHGAVRLVANGNQAARSSPSPAATSISQNAGVRHQILLQRIVGEVRRRHPEQEDQAQR